MASGFNNSFEKSFAQGQTIGASAALESIKEKIKANEESRQSGLIIDTLEARITQNATQSGLPPEQLSGFSKSFDALRKAKLSAAETLSVAKAIAPDQFKDQAPINIYTQGNNGAPTMTGQVPAGSKVFKENLSAEEIGARSLAQREATTENPQIDQQTQGAIAALEFMNPRIESANSLLDKIGKKDFEKLSTQIQIGANNEFLVPNGSPLEELVAELNDIKITGFGIAGSAYTGNERAVVEGGLNPIGKGFERFKRDLNRNKDFFSAKAKSGTMGLKEARKIAEKGSTYSADKTVKTFEGDKEARYQAWKKSQDKK